MLLFCSVDKITHSDNEGQSTGEPSSTGVQSWSTFAFAFSLKRIPCSQSASTEHHHRTTDTTHPSAHLLLGIISCKSIAAAAAADIEASQKFDYLATQLIVDILFLDVIALPFTLRIIDVSIILLFGIIINLTTITNTPLYPSEVRHIPVSIL